MRLFVVDDNPGLRSRLADLFRAHGYGVSLAGSVAEADVALADGGFDLLLLDIGMTGGETVVRGLRNRGVTAPILASLSASVPEQRIAALEAGADVVMTKPFASDELLARVRALLRRPANLRTQTLWIGNIALDTAAQSVRVNGGAVELTRGEIAVLETLMRNNARPVARHALEAAIHSFSSDLSANAIEAAVSRVRRRLDRAGARVTISAARGVGYLMSERLG